MSVGDGESCLYRIGPVLDRVACLLDSDAHLGFRRLYATGDSRIQLCMRSYLTSIRLHIWKSRSAASVPITPPKYASPSRLKKMGVTMGCEVSLGPQSSIFRCGFITRLVLGAFVDGIGRDLSAMTSLSSLKFMATGAFNLADMTWPRSLTRLCIDNCPCRADAMRCMPRSLTSLYVTCPSPLPDDYASTHPHLTDLSFSYVTSDVADYAQILPSTLRTLNIGYDHCVNNLGSPWPCRDLDSFSHESSRSRQFMQVYAFLPPSVTVLHGEAALERLVQHAWYRNLVEANIHVAAVDKTVVDQLSCMINLRKLAVTVAIGGGAVSHLLPCTGTIESLKIVSVYLDFKTTPENTASLTHLVIEKHFDTSDDYQTPSRIDGFGVRTRDRAICLTTRLHTYYRVDIQPATVERRINGHLFVSSQYIYDGGDGAVNPDDVGEECLDAERAYAEEGIRVHDSVAFVVNADGSVSFTELMPRSTDLW